MATSLLFLFTAIIQNSDANRFHPTSFALNPTIPTFRAHTQVPAMSRMTMYHAPTRLLTPSVPSYRRIGGLTRGAAPTSRRQLSSVRMAMGSGEYLPPIGPFCPFRSKTVDSGPLGEEMQFSVDFAPSFALEFSRIQLEMQAGQMPDKAKVLSLADSLTEAAGKFSTAMTRMRMATDFQARELYKITEAFAQRKGESMDSVAVLMRWQADSMRAFASGLPPPMPPPGVDLSNLAQQQAEQPSMMSQVSAAGAIDSLPFTGKEEAFKSENVRKEFEQLTQDHSNMIKMGEQYGSFDPLGKIAFLDAVEAIEDRWDVFFARFSLLGALNPEFKEQMASYLESMGLTPAEFRKVLAEAHELMRKDAEVERIRGDW